MGAVFVATTELQGPSCVPQLPVRLLPVRAVQQHKGGPRRLRASPRREVPQGVSPCPRLAPSAGPPSPACSPSLCNHACLHARSCRNQCQPPAHSRHLPSFAPPMCRFDSDNDRKKWHPWESDLLRELERFVSGCDRTIEVCWQPHPPRPVWWATLTYCVRPLLRRDAAPRQEVGGLGTSSCTDSKLRDCG